MTIELSLLLSGISIAFAVFFGISTRNRNVRKDTQEEAGRDATMLAKMENIQTTLIEFKTELKGYREEIDKCKTQAVRNEESLKSLHKRVDKMEQMLQVSTH